MKVWLNIVLVIGLALGRFPHAFCLCGCAKAPEPKAAPACPHCAEGRGDRAPEKPEPCQCAICDVVKAVPSEPQATVPAPEPSGRIFLSAVSPSVQLALAPLTGGLGQAETSGSYLPSGCALTILLGHLLL